MRKRLSVKELIQNIISVCLCGSEMEYRMKVPDELWSVVIDPKQVQEILNQIFSSPKEAMPSGEILILGRNYEIFDAENSGVPLKKGKYVKLSFLDRGLGISKNSDLKVFDPDFSNKNSGDQGERANGLIIDRSIWVKNDGFIHTGSRSGGGASLHIYLPAVSEENAPVAQRAGEASKYPSRSLKILVMDDDRMMRDVIRVMLKLLKHDVELASKGEDAVERYAEAQKSGAPFDAVILDLTVRGGMGGKETLDKIREFDPDVKAIVSSGHSNSPLVEDYSDFGFSGALPKPYLRKELEAVLNKVAQRD